MQSRSHLIIILFVISHPPFHHEDPPHEFPSHLFLHSQLSPGWLLPPSKKLIFGNFITQNLTHDVLITTPFSAIHKLTIIDLNVSTSVFTSEIEGNMHLLSHTTTVWAQSAYILISLNLPSLKLSETNSSAGCEREQYGNTCTKPLFFRCKRLVLGWAQSLVTHVPDLVWWINNRKRHRKPYHRVSYHCMTLQQFYPTIFQVEYICNHALI